MSDKPALGKFIVPAAPHTWTYDTDQWIVDPILAWQVSDQPDEEARPISIWGLLPPLPRTFVLYDMTHTEAEAYVEEARKESEEWMAGIRAKREAAMA